MKDEIKIRDLRKKEKYQIDDEYLNGYAKLCGIYGTVVYNSLCRHANYKTQEAWPAIETMAEQHNINRKSIIKGIQALESWGIVRIFKEKDEKNKRQKNNIYLLIDRSEWKPKPQSRVPVEDAEKEKAESLPYQSRVPVEDLTRVPVEDCKDYTEEKDYTLKDSATQSVATPSQESDNFFKNEETQKKAIDYLTTKGFNPNYALTEIKKFISYWTEPTKSGKKQRWETEKTYDVRRRLATWLNNSNKFNRSSLQIKRGIEV